MEVGKYIYPNEEESPNCGGKSRGKNKPVYPP